MIEQKIRQSIVLDRTIPDFVLEEFPKFVEFTRSYYRWLESSGNTVDQLNKLLSNKDIDTVDSSEHEYHILNTFMKSIPKNLEVNYSHLLHNIRDFYSRKGTAEAIQSFFYLMSESRKPNTIVLRYSEYEDLLVGEEILGSSSGARGTVIRAKRITTSSDFVVLTIQYTTDPVYRGRFFTSVDKITTSGGEVLDVIIEDFRVEIFYPKEYLLRSSDGVYSREYRCRIRLPQENYIDFTNKPFETSGGSVGRVARQSYSIGSKNDHNYYELTLSFSTQRNWSVDETIVIDGRPVELATVFTGVSIVSPGQNYKTGRTFDIVNNSSEVVGSVIVSEVCVCRIDRILVQSGGVGYSVGDKFRFKYSDGLYGSGYVSTVSGGSITSLVLESTRKGSSEIPTVIFDTGNQSATLHPYGPRLSGIDAVKISDFGFDVDKNVVVEMGDHEEPYSSAILNVEVGTLYRTYPKFKDERGQLSSFYRLQDNFYWQDFSYVLKFNKPVDVEKNDTLFRQTVHPAGFKYFYEFVRTEDAIDADLTIKDANSERELQINRVLGDRILDVAYQEIGTIDRIKDTNHFHVFTYPFYTREMVKSWVFDSQMRFDGFATIDEISAFSQQVNKYSNSIHVHPAHITVV